MQLGIPKNNDYWIHVSGKCEANEWLPKDLEICWQIFVEILSEIHEDHPISTHAFVLMKNHYHWLCAFDLEDDPHLFEWFHECIQVRFLRWGIQYLKDPFVLKIKNYKHYKKCFKYIYSNPITAGLTRSCENYPYSTLPYVLNGGGLNFSCGDNLNLIGDTHRVTQWLNGGREELRYITH